jgi:predicted hydrolase (HD superfamily)
MTGLYDYFKENNLLDVGEPTKDVWELSGLIHDIDFSAKYKETHPQKTRQALADHGLTISETVYNIVQAHDGRGGIKCKNKAEWSIFCADSLTGLITAVALVYPNKKINEVKLSSVLKRFLKEPKFAAGTRRDEVAMCSESSGLNLPLEKFVEICLLSMQKISDKLGL